MLVAHPELVDRLAGPRPAAPRAGRARRRPGRRSSSRWPTVHVRRAPRRRLGRAAGAAAAGRAVGRPQPHLHVRHDRPVEGRPGLARRLLELRQLLHRAVRRRERPLPAAAADVLHGGHGDHVLDAPGRRLARATRRASARRRFWDDVRRFEATITIAIHGMVTFMLDQPARAGRRRQSAARRLHGPADAPPGVRRALRLPRLHRVRDDRGAGADRLRARPRGRAQLRTRRRPRALRAAARRRARRSGAGRHAGRAHRAPLAVRGRSTRATRTCPRRPRTPGATAGSTPATSSSSTRTGTSSSSTG